MRNATFLLVSKCRIQNGTCRPRQGCGTRLFVRAKGAERDFPSAPKALSERSFQLPCRRRGQSRNATFRPRRRRGTKLAKKKPPIETKMRNATFLLLSKCRKRLFKFHLPKNKKVEFELAFLSIKSTKRQNCPPAARSSFLPRPCAALRGRRGRRGKFGAFWLLLVFFWEGEAAKIHLCLLFCSKGEPRFLAGGGGETRRGLCNLPEFF
jgi:hypothetical protein